MSEAQRLLDDAKRLRSSGQLAKAETAYLRASEVARIDGDEPALAHALRHLCDLERERGEHFEARRHALEASDLYRRSSDRLGLANSLRLQALSAADPDQARLYWSEARDLYASLDIAAGVRECDDHLHG